MRKYQLLLLILSPPGFLCSGKLGRAGLMPRQACPGDPASCRLRLEVGRQPTVPGVRQPLDPSIILTVFDYQPTSFCCSDGFRWHHQHNLKSPFRILPVIQTSGNKVFGSCCRGAGQVPHVIVKPRAHFIVLMPAQIQSDYEWEKAANHALSSCPTCVGWR